MMQTGKDGVGPAQAAPLPGTDAHVPRLPGPDFSDKILHYQMHLVLPESSGPDDHFIADVWIYFGKENKPVRTHALTTHNGKPEQAVFYDFARRTTTLVSSTRIFAEAEETICSMESEIPAEALLKHLSVGVPIYTSTKLLEKSGFAASSERLDSKALVESDELGPQEAIIAEGDVETLELASGANRTIVQVEADTGRIVSVAVFTGPMKTYEQIDTPIEVFDAKNAPTPLVEAESLEDLCK
jgi:hypothetical protein